MQEVHDDLQLNEVIQNEKNNSLQDEYSKIRDYIYKKPQEQESHRSNKVSSAPLNFSDQPINIDSSHGQDNLIDKVCQKHRAEQEKEIMSDMIIQKEDELNKKLLVYFRNAPKWPDWILNEKSHKKDKE